jgi:hypothetical protein
MSSEPAPEQTVVGEEDARVFAVLAGGPSKAGEHWQVDLLAVAPGRSLEAFAPRLLAIADALAADEGLASVCLTVEAPTHDVHALLDHEGFRVAREEGGKISMTRPVVPQG